MENESLIPRLRRTITDEIVAAFGLPCQGWIRGLLGLLFWPPAQIFSRLVAGIDQPARENGLPGAAQYLLPNFVQELKVQGEQTIPKQGPLIVASNHPGAYDAIAILSRIPRPDIKIVVSDVPFFRNIPSVSRLMIFTPPGSYQRMTAVREMIRYLKSGGAILIFPSGLVDPDPAFMPGAEKALDLWSRSLSLALKNVPNTKIQVAIVGGVLAPACIRNPLTRLPDEPWKQQKLAEFLQVMQQLLFHRDFSLNPSLFFSSPLTTSELVERLALPDLHQAITALARQVMRQNCWLENPVP